MTFDQSAFSDTVSIITRDLSRLEQTVRWLAPCAYETSSGGKTSPKECKTCKGKGRLCPGPPRRICGGDCGHPPCNDCVVAVIRNDAGNVIIRSWNIRDHLDNAARELDRIWSQTKGLDKTVGKLARLIDEGTAHEAGMGPPEIDDPHEVLRLVKAKERRVERGEDPAPVPAVAKEVASALKTALARQQAADEAAERNANRPDDGKSGNRWRR